MENLEKYHEKRDFQRTSEPKGKKGKSKDKLIFVVQHHLATRDHFDFRLEWEGVLLSWAVFKGPSFNPADKRLSVKVENHPLDYRSFEGTIPKGEYGGGVVMLWDEGFYEAEENVSESLKKGVLKLTLSGHRLKGKWTLLKIKNNERFKDDNWLFVKEKDEYVKQSAGISSYDTSIKSGLKMAEIEKKFNKEQKIKNPFSKTDIQLAKLVESFPEGNDWIYEMKYDGYRIVSYLEGGHVRLLSRNEHDYNKYFTEVSKSLVDWAKDRAMVLDGEMIVIDKKGSDFQALQNYLKNPKDKNLVYVIFDLLSYNGEDLRNKPLLERKKILKEIMKDAPRNLHYATFSKGNDEKNLKKVCSNNCEGLIYKKIHSHYSGNRNGDWLKIKCEKRQEFLIGGYTQRENKNKIKAVLLGYYADEKLIYAGRAGTGFTEAASKDLLAQFRKLTRKSSPFDEIPKKNLKEETFWLKPILAAEIKFLEWTSENVLRQASFKGLRADKNTKEIIKEKEDLEIIEAKKIKNEKKEEEIKLTNPNKLLFSNPDITKADIKNYYESVSEKMLPFLSRRLLSLVNCPKGVTEPCFFKKHPLSTKGIETFIDKNKAEKEYFYLTDFFGILSQIQMNTLEFHIWGSTVDNLEKPDIMVFDLDPDENMSIDSVRQGVKDLKSILDKLNLRAFLKTSGGKGYHVVLPFKPSAQWPDFTEFSKKVAIIMEKKWPDRYTSNSRKENRRGKIYIDWQRNSRGQTSIAAYSVRARNGAKVSMPIKWSELDKILPDEIDIFKAIKRIKNKDPWQDFYEIGMEQQLK